MKLARAHRRADPKSAPDIDWRRIGAALEPAVRARTAALFRARALEEERATRAMQQLALDLECLRARDDVIDAAWVVACDEESHVTLCTRTAHALEPSVELLLPQVHAPLPHDGPRERLAASAIALLCVGETLSVAMLQASRDACDDPTLARVLEELLRDEATHSRFGWWWLEEHAAALDEADRARANAMLVRLFARLDVAFRTRERAFTPGAPRPEDERALMERTLTTKILPGLERAGLHANAAWVSRTKRETT